MTVFRFQPKGAYPWQGLRAKSAYTCSGWQISLVAQSGRKAEKAKGVYSVDCHPEWRVKLQVVYGRYKDGLFDLPELQQRLNSLRALLPNDTADDVERLLEQMELIRLSMASLVSTEMAT